MTAKTQPSALPPLPRPPAAMRRNQALMVAGAIGSVVLLVIVLITMDMPPWTRVVTGLQRSFPPLWRGFSRPDWELFPLAFNAMTETFFMAILGTILGGVLAFSLAFLASGNLLGGTRWALPGKAILVAIHTFPEILLAIIFVAAAGPGPTAGIMAMGIHSIGFLGKIFSDVIEGIDQGPMEAIRASGGNQLHVFIHSVVPQVLPEFMSNLLYRFEINLRSAAVLGLVGAGGIGGPLIQRLQFRRWDEISMLLLVIIAFVVVVDAISSRLRRNLV